MMIKRTRERHLNIQVVPRSSDLLFAISAADAANISWSWTRLPSAKEARESGAGMDGLRNPISEQDGMICQYRTFLLNWSLSRKNPYPSVP